MFYVYEWFIISTGEVIYVGKGCRRRYKVRQHNKFFNDMIKRYDCDSRIIKRFDDEQSAFEYEHQRICELKAIGQCVCNIYDGGCGGTTTWWTDELRQQYSQHNVMKSASQRDRMKKHNPMSNKEIAEKTNGQKRRKVTIGNITYISIKAAAEALNVGVCTIHTWGKHGFTDAGETCIIEPQKQHKHKK